MEDTGVPEKTIKIAMSIPSEGHTLPEAYDNHLIQSYHLGRMEERMIHEKRSPRYEFFWFTTGRLLTPLAREKLVENALSGGMDYIIMYDDDMILPIDMVDRFIDDIEQNPEIDILSPLAFMRNPPHYAVMYTVTEGYDKSVHKPYFINNFVRKYPRNKLVECDAVGFGAVMIKLDFVRKHMRPHYFFSTTGTGEDIYFCMKAKQAGAKIFMDTRIKLGHIANPHIIDEEYFDKYLKENNIELPEVPHKYLEVSK